MNLFDLSQVFHHIAVHDCRRYTDGKRLCSYDLSTLPPTALSFNPANWRQLCLSTLKEISLWNIEQRDEIFVIQKE